MAAQISKKAFLDLLTNMAGLWVAVAGSYVKDQEASSYFHKVSQTCGAYRDKFRTLPPDQLTSHAQKILPWAHQVITYAIPILKKSGVNNLANSLEQSYRTAVGEEQNGANSSVKDELLELVKQDQEGRGQYKSYLSKYGDWKQAAAQFRKDHHSSPNDLFGDASRLEKAKKLIRSDYKAILADPELLDKIGVLVQHMDNDVPFQKWFLKHVPQNSQWHNLLHDRVSVNTGQSQKYGTQQEAEISRRADALITRLLAA